MDILALGFILAAFLLLFGLGFMVYSARFFDARQVDERVKRITEQGNQQSLYRGGAYQEAEFNESFLNRTLVPVVNSVINYFGRFTPRKSIQEINRQLTLAGSNIRAQQYYGIRLVLMMLGIGILLLHYNLQPSMNTLLIDLFIILVLFSFPILWLRSNVRRKQNQIALSLPDSLDMLSVCAAAGLGFDQAMLRVSQFFKNPVGLELARVVAEMEMGVTRAQALRNFADRVDLAEVSSFVAVVVQSDKLGISIADTLQSQAELMRIQRQFRAKEIAQRLPAKMMIPLAFLILPALLAVLLGPTVPTIMELF